MIATIPVGFSESTKPKPRPDFAEFLLGYQSEAAFGRRNIEPPFLQWPTRRFPCPQAFEAPSLTAVSRQAPSPTAPPIA